MKRCCEEWLRSQFGDDRETIEAVYAEYIETMADLGDQFASARRDGDAAELDRVLHTIKGSAAMAGDMELSALAQRARGDVGTDCLDALAQQLSSLE